MTTEEYIKKKTIAKQEQIDKRKLDILLKVFISISRNPENKTTKRKDFYKYCTSFFISEKNKEKNITNKYGNKEYIEVRKRFSKNFKQNNLSDVDDFYYYFKNKFKL